MTDVPTALLAGLAEHYRIERELGAGGMATVYLAHDIKHDRQVAIKVLRPELSAVIGAERFLREIKTIANLQHPHILGLIDSGQVDGTAYYVMPYVDGESLRDRLIREKQLGVADAVRIATEVASALDYAHRHNVIHRDIKPENILLHDGQALVADFGIALAVSNTGKTRMTETGMSLGTPHYMSPEQAMGERDITARSDVYALGCVTYEMLVGEPPFNGPTAQAIIARVMTEEPRSLTLQRKTIPPHVEAAVNGALAKLPADRFATAREFSDALAGRAATHAFATPAGAAVAGRQARAPGWRARLTDPAVIMPSVAAVALAAVAWHFAERPVPSPLPTIRFALATTDSTRAFDNFPWPAAISPDGSTVVYTVAPLTGAPSLYYVRTDQLTAHPIPGTTGAYQPYFSPDGQWLAFELSGKERKVRLDGSAPVTITDAGGANGGVWTTGNEIVLGSQGTFAGLSRVSAAGGTAVALTHVDSTKGERNHLWPVVTADGKAVIFTSWTGSLATAQIAMASLGDGKVAHLGIPGIRPLAVLDGMLIYVKVDGSVMAVGLDESGRRIRGTSVPVHDPVPVLAALNGNSGIYISAGGGLITSVGGSTGRLSWVDLKGRTSLISSKAGVYRSSRLSPDQRQIAVLLEESGQSDVWIDDLSLGTLSKLTTLTTVSSLSWSPDGGTVFYLAADQTGNTLWRQRASGGVAADKIVDLPYAADAAAVAPDGKSVLVTVSPGDQWQVRRVLLDSANAVRPYLAVPGNVHAAQFSPDGKWVALVDDESGQDEVYLRSYPDPTSKLQVSVGGGEAPMWSADGSHLYYVSGSALLGVHLTTSAPLKLLGRDTVLATFPGAANAAAYFNAGFQPARDGLRILTSLPDRNDYQLVVSPNWITEFRRRVAESRGGK